MANTQTKLTGAQLFLARQRYAGYDSLEEQQAGNAAAVEEQISRGTRHPPGYGNQTAPAAPLPWRPASAGPPVAPSAAEAVARGVTAPPYAKKRKLGGRDLFVFRGTHGRDPTDEEEEQLVGEGNGQ
jgi:hypothetical protein